MKKDRFFTGNVVLWIHGEAKCSNNSLRGSFSIPRRSRSNSLTISLCGRNGRLLVLLLLSHQTSSLVTSICRQLTSSCSLRRHVSISNGNNTSLLHYYCYIIWSNCCCDKNRNNTTTSFCQLIQFFS